MINHVETKTSTVLYLIHRTGGGTPAVSLELAKSLATYQKSLAVVTSPEYVTLEDWTTGKPFILLKWFRKEKTSPTSQNNDEYSLWLEYVLDQYKVDLVHVRHTYQESLPALARVLKKSKLPVVLSIHDYYYACPRVNFVNKNNQFCDGLCDVKSNDCSAAVSPHRKAIFSPENRSKEITLATWRNSSQKLIDVSNVLVFPTKDSQNRFSRVMHRTTAPKTVISHGRTFSASWFPFRKQRQPGPIRIALMANWAPHKGIEYIRRAMKIAGADIEWHVFGEDSSVFSDVAVVHGSYSRNELPLLLENVDPDYSGFFSICAETFSHSLSESWRLGIPVLVSDIGAPMERVQEFGGGYVVDHNNPEDMVNRVLGIDEIEYSKLRESVSLAAQSLQSADQMAQNYFNLYSTLLGKK